ncbi:MAG: 4'-phosphopantetheinyl transferase superfamily protein [Chitinophagaceae bacterium]|nr:MAG: 4'-phosphopantetheinyl transferase superfamily protein [Chitinophagaceae bacterium]
MGLFYQHSVNPETKIGIWTIEEPEEFFLESVPVKRDVSHPAKRLQHLAGRFLLPYMMPDFPLRQILVADTRKPYLADDKYHFSISHCGTYAGVIVSSTQRVGIDIEVVSTRMYNIMHKFVNENERQFLAEWEGMDKLHLELTTVLWSAKEAVFKWYGLGKIDFREHMQLSGNVIFRADEWIELPFTFSKDKIVELKVMAKIFGDVVLAWVVS